MAISDIYEARSGLYTIVNTTATPFLSLFGYPSGGTAHRCWVVGVRVGIGASSAAAGNTLLFQLARPAASTVNASSVASGVPHDFSASPSIGQVATAYTTPPTPGLVLWEQELPQSTGSAWEEFPPLGYEWGVPALANNAAVPSIGLHMFVTAGVTTATIVYADLIWSE
jgi:hypothetical protein